MSNLNKLNPRLRRQVEEIREELEFLGVKKFKEFDRTQSRWLHEKFGDADRIEVLKFIFPSTFTDLWIGPARLSLFDASTLVEINTTSEYLEIPMKGYLIGGTDGYGNFVAINTQSEALDVVLVNYGEFCGDGWKDEDVIVTNLEVAKFLRQVRSNPTEFADIWRRHYG